MEVKGDMDYKGIKRIAGNILFRVIK